MTLSSNALSPTVIAELRRAFGANPPFETLRGGGDRAFAAGEIVLRQEDDPTDPAFIADVYERIPASSAFRVPRPIRSADGEWLTGSGWSAWTFVTGRAAAPEDLPRVIPAVEAFHAALAGGDCPAALAERDSPYDRADRAAWGRIPARVAPPLAPFVATLARLRRPLAQRRLRPQLIHGDLNPDNILVVADAPPALIDMAPYWRPAGFGLAVLGYWLGPAVGDSAVLAAFEAVPAFDQLLVRAALRSVLIWHEFAQVGRPLGDVEEAFGRAVATTTEWVQRRPRTA
jgi:uncharacterized protein (TIGR02569 family)